MNTTNPTQEQFIRKFFPEAVTVHGVKKKELMDFERSNVHVETYKHKGVDETSICENMERDNVKFQHKLEVGKIVHKVLLREGFPEHSLRPEYQQSLNTYRDHKLPITPDAVLLP